MIPHRGTFYCSFMNWALLLRHWLGLLARHLVKQGSAHLIPRLTIATGPRPLRSATRLFGLEGLKPRELRQCHVGGNFFLQGVLALSFHIRFGGSFISEHPAAPKDASRPSVWTSAILELLQRLLNVQLTHVASNGVPKLSSLLVCSTSTCAISDVISTRLQM